MTGAVVRYGVLGVGSIASAIVTGLCEGMADPPTVALSPRNAARAADLAGRLPTVSVATDNQGVLDAADVVLVCLPPGPAAETLNGLAFRSDHAVLSAVAGLPVAALAAAVAPATQVARSIPLPAVATRTGVTPLHPDVPAGRAVFDRLGGTLVIEDERAFDATSAASATVAAHFRYLDSVATWLTAQGIPVSEARRFVAQTFAALAGELADPEPDFVALAAAHATPGGLNEQFARRLDGAGVYAAVDRGLDEVMTRIAPR